MKNTDNIQETEALVDFLVGSNKPDEIKRGLVIFASRFDHVSRNEIADAVNMTIPFVDKCRKIHKAEGIDRLKHQRKGSQSYLSNHAQDQIVDWIRSHDTVTLHELHQYIQETYGVVYQSESSYYQFFDRANFSYKKTQAINPKEDEEQIAEKKHKSRH